MKVTPLIRVCGVSLQEPLWSPLKNSTMDKEKRKKMRREKKQPAHLLGVSFACGNSKTMRQPACAGAPICLPEGG
jgi:hypothetical protein